MVTHLAWIFSCTLLGQVLHQKLNCALNVALNAFNTFEYNFRFCKKMSVAYIYIKVKINLFININEYDHIWYSFIYLLNKI